MPYFWAINIQTTNTYCMEEHSKRQGGEGERERYRQKEKCIKRERDLIWFVHKQFNFNLLYNLLPRTTYRTLDGNQCEIYGLQVNDRLVFSKNTYEKSTEKNRTQSFPHLNKLKISTERTEQKIFE